MTTRIVMLRRGVVALLVAGVAVLTTATPASAHTDLEKSDPAKGAALSTPPVRVSLTFGEPVRIAADPITVTGADGTTWTVGPAGVTDATVSAPVQATGPAGAYTLTWTVVADDGDTLRGTIPFTLTVAATPTTTVAAPSPSAAASTVAPAAAAPATAASDSGGVPTWVWIVGGVVVLAAIGGVAARSRRSTSGS
jgi:copper resistance protein C